MKIKSLLNKGRIFKSREHSIKDQNSIPAMISSKSAILIM